MRGRGGWLSDQGEFVLHVGDAVLINNEALPTGEYEEYIYPTRPVMPRPIPATAKDMEDLLNIIKKWNWGRPDKDPLLLLGWMGTAILTAALQWRTSVFVDAAAGAGKSTLQNYLTRILKGRAVVSLDASEAGIRAAQGVDARVVLLDEVEPKANDAGRTEKIMALARLAASGGRVLRATKDQTTKEFNLKAGFLFSAVRMPRMAQEDTQRFAFLRLLKPPKDAKRLPEITIAEGQEIGQKLAGRMVKAWPRFNEVLRNYRELLEDEAHDPRGSENFGTLLATADCILYDEYDGDRAAAIAKSFNAKTLEEYEEREENWYSCLRTILQAQPEVWRSYGFPTVGQKIKEFIREEQMDLIPDDNIHKEDFEVRRRDINRMLEKTGIKLVVGKDKIVWLAVPNNNPLTRKLFVGSDYYNSNWSRSLQQAVKYDGENGIYKTQQVEMGGVRPNCTMINLMAKYDFGNDGVLKPIFAIDEGAG